MVSYATALMVEHKRDGNMQRDVTVTFLNELASVLSFRKTQYWKVEKYTFKRVVNVETMNVI